MGVRLEFDYLIIGGGSAGCVLAARLSEDPNHRVCLVEAGPDDRSPLIRVPFGAITMVPTRYHNWAYQTVSQPQLNDRYGYQPRGKVLGGSSAINAMIYMRGHPEDYDDWAAMGNSGWAWQDVLPLFQKSEGFVGQGEVNLHGTEGELTVSDLRSPRAASRAFITAGVEAGLPENIDFNGVSQEGVGLFHVTQRNGERCSSARAFLDPVRDRANLTILTKAQAKHLRFSGDRCSGAVVQLPSGSQTLAVTKEVILTAGSFGSPHLLMLSGIGDGDRLQKYGINVQKHLPGVGKNLQDHLDYISAFESPDKSLLGISGQGMWNLLKGYRQYRKHRSGILTTNFAEAGAFFKTESTLSRPDIQLHFVVAILIDHARKIAVKHGFSCHTCVLRPKSRGSVSLASNHFDDAPLIDPGFLNDADDLQRLVKGIRKATEVLYQPALNKFRAKDRYQERQLTDKQLIEQIRQRADTIYHPVGTCKMGQDEWAVVDAELRVHGIEGLRVADASIMPTLIGGNTNAPTIMIGEKAAQLITRKS